MKKVILLLALAPMLAAAQAGPGPGSGTRAPGGPGGPGGDRPDPARLEKRLKLALTLGLAEALELDDAQALRVRDQVEKTAARRQAAHQQQRDAMQVLRRTAQGEKVATGEVDGAIARLFDARALLQGLDRELVQAITRDLPPEKKARAVLFMARFHQKIAQAAGGRGRGKGPDGRGMGRGMGGPGPGRFGPPGAGPRGELGGAGGDADDLADDEL